MISQNPYGFIYITTNLVNGKRYIGQRKFSNGWRNYVGSGTHLKEAIGKYGREKFSRVIVSIAYSKSELDDMEIDLIKFLNAESSRDFYNIAEGGCVKGRAGKNAFWYGKKIPYEIINSANEKRNKEVYQFTLDGELIGEYISASVAATYNGLQKQNISISCLDESKTCGGFFWSHNKNRTNFNYDLTKNHKLKPVFQCNSKTGEIVAKFESVKDASNITGIDKANIHSCCLGRRKNAGGYAWRH